ncbi:hypothetical protein O4H53_25265 [Sulfitobacter sp. G21635-S1]|uniref:hypothetical protein n=1 Tax=Sulfitobacter sp. G21635-S1 TaxID=3014043 RepID=UPI0022B0345C|nr:hypothetical protein [Sulfitobacter sp. G21635-S1]MCZ4258866.1 hypothetical protein [Sulfitobacter sp. G21635-S1]
MTFISLHFQQTANQFKMAFLCDSLITKEGSEDQSHEPLTLPFPRPKSDQRETVGLHSKLFFISQTLAFAWSGSLLAAEKAVELLFELNSNNPEHSAPELVGLVKAQLDPFYLKRLTMIVARSCEGHCSFESYGCETLEFSKGRLVIVGGSGKNYQDLIETYLPDFERFERQNEKIPAQDQDFGHGLCTLIQNFLVSEGVVRDFTMYATGGWYELCFATNEGFEKVPYTVVSLYNHGPEGDIDLLYAARPHFSGQQTIVARTDMNGMRFPIPDDANVTLTRLKTFHAKYSKIEQPDTCELKWPDHFFDTGFGEYTSSFATFCIVCHDNRVLGCEALSKNPINFERVAQSISTNLIRDIFADYFVESMDHRIATYIRNRADASD